MTVVHRYLSALEQRLDRVESSLRDTNDLLARVSQGRLRESAKDCSEEAAIGNGNADIGDEADSGMANVDAMGAVIFADESESGYFGEVFAPRHFSII